MIHKILSYLLAVCLFVSQIPVYSSTTIPTITANSAIVMEASSGRVLYDKYADALQVPGSMTKVMTAYIVFEEIYLGNLSFDTQLTITASQASFSSDGNYPAAVPLPSGSQITVDTLLRLLFLPSASGACLVLAEHISGSETAFVARMNETAQRLSVEATYTSCHGVTYHKLTARGQARLIQQFIQRFPQVLFYTSLTSVTFNGKTYSNTNYLLLNKGYYYSGCDGFKTGTLAGYCLSSTAVRDGVRLIVVVMNSISDSYRHSDSITLLDYGFAQMSENPQYYHDMWTYPASEWVYDRFRRKNILVHGVNGWAVPTAETTRGEFAVTLLSALEAYALYPTVSTIPPQSLWVSDIHQYYGGELVQRAVGYGLFSTNNEGAFFPNSPLTQEEVTATFQKVASALGWTQPLPDTSLSTPEPMPEPSPEPVPESSGNTSAEDGSIPGLAPSALDSSALQRQVLYYLPYLPFPRSYVGLMETLLNESPSPQDSRSLSASSTLTRGEMMEQLRNFLSQYIDL